MKKTLLVILATLLCITSTTIAFAHPPKNVELTWSAATNTLSVKASHLVNNPTKHYVMLFVVLDSSNKQIYTKQYTKQALDTTFADSAILKDIKTGDTIKIRLVCNIMGIVEKEIKLQ